MLTSNKQNLSTGTIVRNIRRPDKEVIETIGRAYTGFVLDRIGKRGAMHYSIKPITSGMRLCGAAVTVQGPDLSVRRMAINLAQEGDILVVAAGGSKDFACFGDGTATRMSLKSIAGAVIDGATRDLAGLRKMEYPTFARSARPDNFHYPIAGAYGGVNIPVDCGGVRVNPGDIIMADDDGVIVIPLEISHDVAKIVAQELDEEITSRENMTEFVEIAVEDELKSRGYTFV